MKIERLETLCLELKKLRNRRDGLQMSLAEIDSAIAEGVKSKLPAARVSASLEISVPGATGLTYTIPLEKVRSFVEADLAEASSNFDSGVDDLISEFQTGGGTLE